MENLEYKFFTVKELPLLKGRKTHVYDIRGINGGELGVIEWYGSWRQFVFVPMVDTVWSDGCLKDVQDALAKIKAAK